MPEQVEKGRRSVVLARIHIDETEIGPEMIRTGSASIYGRKNDLLRLS